MAGSFKKIDYRLRPAKAVERRMLAEAFLRLREFGAIESYRYVGMGSVYFSDFSVFFPACGFQSMISIEDCTDPTIQKRFDFNLPYGHIELCFQHSSQAIKDIDWTVRSVIWLDYDGSLDKSVLDDVSFLASKVTPGCLLAVSVNAKLDDEDQGTAPPLEVLVDRLGDKNKIPLSVVSEGRLRPKDVLPVYREIIDNEIKSALLDRNAGRPEAQRLEYRQILYFSYKDGAPMLTLAWVFMDSGQREIFAKCGFDKLTFYRDGELPFNIDIPLLTNAEMRAINRIKSTPGAEPQEPLPIPEREITKYLALKRYWPLVGNPELT